MDCSVERRGRAVTVSFSEDTPMRPVRVTWVRTLAESDPETVSKALPTRSHLTGRLYFVLTARTIDLALDVAEVAMDAARDALRGVKS